MTRPTSVAGAATVLMLALSVTSALGAQAPAAGKSIAGGTGTNRADTYVGTAAAERYAGRGGNDRINGRGGSDIVRGGPGDDTIRPGRGADRVLAGSGRDTILIDADGRPDVTNCGPGRDTVVTTDALDPADRYRSCEKRVIVGPVPVQRPLRSR